MARITAIILAAALLSQVENGAARALQDTDDIVLEDMMLSPGQAKALRTSAMNNPARMWPEVNGFPEMPYTFVDDKVNRTGVRIAVKEWTDNTCFRMPEVPNTYIGNHVFFEDKGGCSAQIGMRDNGSGQRINANEGCSGKVRGAIHEIGHTVGLYHEQFRSDRDSYIFILDGAKLNNDNNYSVPYDYTSKMHYGAAEGNGIYNIVPKDLRFLPFIGRAWGLSHMDKLLVNRMYRCTDKWLESCGLTEDPCLNYGYIGADCTCVCPPNADGENCENKFQEYGEHRLNDCAVSVTSEGTMTSPDFPNNNFLGKCIKVIQAPECQRVQVTFSNFHLSARKKNGKCPAHFLDLIEQKPALNYTRYCGNDISEGQVFTSTSNELALYHVVKDSYNEGMGWEADIAFIDDPSC